MTKKKERNPTSVSVDAKTAETTELLQEIAKDKQRIRQLCDAKNRIDKALKAIRVKMDENETLVYQKYEPAEPPQVADTLKQLELF